MKIILITVPEMQNFVKISRIIVLIMAAALLTGCAPAKKNPYYEKRAKSSQVHASQLGRNRYYYTPNYQKRLAKSYKRK